MSRGRRRAGGRAGGAAAAVLALLAGPGLVCAAAASVSATLETGAQASATSPATPSAISPRRLPTLALDPAFGARGRATLAIERVFSIQSQAGTPDGGLVLGGSLWSGEGLVARLTHRGRIDRRFAEEGLLRIPGPEPAGLALLTPAEVRVDAQGRVLAARLGLGRNELRRYTADGHPDESFGAGGVPPSPLPPFSSPLVTTAPDGGVVLAPRRGSGAVAVARLLPDGTPDPAFARGIATLGPPAEATGVAFHSVGALEVDRHGRVVMSVTWGSGRTAISTIARLGSGGRPDPSFDGDGIALTPRVPSDIAVQPGGGVAFTARGRRVRGVFPIVVGRLTARGAPDRATGPTASRASASGRPSASRPTCGSGPTGASWSWPGASWRCSTGAPGRWRGSAGAARRACRDGAPTGCRSSTLAAGSSCIAAGRSPRR